VYVHLQSLLPQDILLVGSSKCCYAVWHMCNFYACSLRFDLLWAFNYSNTGYEKNKKCAIN
jgi:hypothetical protein